MNSTSGEIRESKKRTAICFFTDRNYFYPTLISAYSCREHTDPSAADMIIMCVGLDGDFLSRWEKIALTKQIKIISVKRAWDGLYDITKFRKAHVSDVAIGRFFMSEFLEGYDRFIYIDGDTLIKRSLHELVSLKLPPGHIAAVVDSLSFARSHSSRLGDDTRRYFRSIDVPDNDQYFNSGVIVADLETWSIISKSALQFFINNTHLCHHHDQTALNVTCNSYIEPISICWNYQSNFTYWGLDSHVNIALKHFAGLVKPWIDSSWPFIHAAQDYEKYVRQIGASGVDQPLPPKTNIRKSARQIAKVAKFRFFQRYDFEKTVKDILLYENTVLSSGLKNCSPQEIRGSARR